MSQQIDYTRCTHCNIVLPDSTQDHHGHLNSTMCYDCFRASQPIIGNNVPKLIQMIHSDRNLPNTFVKIVVKEFSTPDWGDSDCRIVFTMQKSFAMRIGCEFMEQIQSAGFVVKSFIANSFDNDKDNNPEMVLFLRGPEKTSLGAYQRNEVVVVNNPELVRKN